MSCTPFPQTLPTTTLYRSRFEAVCYPLLQDDSGGPTSISLTAWLSYLSLHDTLAKRNHTRDGSTPVVHAEKSLATHRERLILVEQLPEFLGTKTRIRLQGAWLTAAGFLPRTHVRVRVMTGCLVITLE
ncbi:SymE family type I addiction module toxin [Collimonas silvisoli]|uniref:SymE family type I addiction module toxin n=1 Tax=Collimonas silvisoli TaxID=2825884 RepID=UPI0038B30641